MKNYDRLFYDHHSCAKCSAAFTLAEVLITLGVIGVVAAMTLPSLVNKYKERQYVTALKKAYSVLDNAYRLAIYENGGSSEFNYMTSQYVKDENNVVYDKNGAANAEILLSKFKPHIKIIKECDGVTARDCFAETITSPFRSTTWNLIDAQGKSRRFVVLSDGSSVGFAKNSIYVDVNGTKTPNKVGVDIFQFSPGTKSLELYDDATAEVKCYTNEFTCSAWVIINDNMDYLHCSDLDWKTKTKCN